MKNYEIKFDINENAKTTQQKSRRIPIHLQNQVDKEIENLLKDWHIEKVDKIQDNVFIQPTVKNSKKGQVR